MIRLAAAAVFVVGVLSACAPASESSASAPEAKAAPAFVEGLPRDQWLTLDSAVPVGDEGVVRDEKRRPYGYELLGQKIPPFTAELLGGGPVTENIFRDKWTIVDVWGIWCGDCRRDAPLVRSLYQLTGADAEIGFISLHTPPNRSRAAEAYGQYGSIEAYFAAEGGDYPVIVDKDASVREALKIVWTPTYLLVGPDLTVQAFRTDLSVGDEAGLARVIAEAKAIRVSAPPA